MIEVCSVDKSFLLHQQKIEVLKNINFRVAAGESIAICGESGAGKSTLLQIIGALERPSRGEIRYEGKDIFSLSQRQLAAWRNHCLGFVFQFHHLLPEFSALENVMIPALINGESRQQAAERALELLSRVGLAQRTRHKPGEMSGGEQQRVALARALVMHPQALLADEPTGNLDLANSKEIIDLLLEFNREFNTTLLLVTHSRRSAEKMNRQISIENGCLKED